MNKAQVRTRKRVQPIPTIDPDFSCTGLSCTGLHDDLRIAVRYQRCEELKPPKRILRKHNDRQIEMIKASIRGHGFNNPILVNSQNEIVSGYGRWLAAIALGMVEVPVIVLEHLTQEQLRLFAIADNRIAEQSEFDLGELKLELAELEQGPGDILQACPRQSEERLRLYHLDAAQPSQKKRHHLRDAAASRR